MRFPFMNSKTSIPRKTSGAVSTLNIGAEDSIYTEQIKALRAKVEYRIDQIQAKTFAVTSAVSGEGKTTLCVKLAANLASSGRKKVLLIDTDMRKADLARGLGLPGKPGLSDFITGGAPLSDIVCNTVAPGLTVIPAGLRVSEPADLLSGNVFRDFLGSVKDGFDVVLLDTPPVLPVADTLSLRDLVDGFIFVYRAGFTPHKMFSRAAEEIGEKGILGVVINGVEPERQRYYERYYGSYYQRPSASDHVS
ncbi:MAG TPA: CpsD/CapB family tyrosine-protein kinase [Candidatus Deferrimicrobiaceae bacterium]|jgi:capsular exopolysaccharide synthesis family protein